MNSSFVLEALIAADDMIIAMGNKHVIRDDYESLKASMQRKQEDSSKLCIFDLSEKNIPREEIEIILTYLLSNRNKDYNKRLCVLLKKKDVYGIQRLSKEIQKM